MAPGSGKRKRGERQFSQDDGSNRPSPHRPERMGLAQQSESHGGRRGGRSNGNRGQDRHGGDNAVDKSVPSPSPATPHMDNAHQNGTPGPEISRSNTPLPPQAAKPSSPTQPKPPPAPYTYDYLTDDIVESWAETGKQSLMDTTKEADDMTTCMMLQELVRAGLDARLDPTEAGLVVRQMMTDQREKDGLDIQSHFLNTISLLDESETKDPALFDIVAATDIDPEIIRQELDVTLLQDLSVVRSSFVKIRTRKTTNLLYRQANFNLLREETEGYAKLMTEYFNTAQQVGLTREPNPRMAEDAFQRVKALVGAFDLDIGRVLDITLDISANLLVKAYGFFMKFYRCSSWWPDNGLIDEVKWEDQGFSTFPNWALPGSGKITPSDDERDALVALKHNRDVRFWERVNEVGMDAFFELGARRIVDFDSVAELLNSEVEPQVDAHGREVNQDKRKRINESRKYMRETRTLPPQGNPDAAQLLGFKFRFYASPVRSAQDKLPENLMALAALLIKIGLISMRDFYPHLYPSDDQMEEEEKVKLATEKADRERKNKPGASSNALLLSGALPDDTAPAPVRSLRGEKDKSGGTTPKAELKEEDNLPKPENQKIMLLRALLLIGAIPEALYILGRFPWLAELDPTIAPYLLRIVKHMFSKVADSVRPLANRTDLDTPSEQLADTVSGANGSMLFTSRVKKNPVKWLQLDKFDEDTGGEYKFYYSDWADNVPICQNLDDIFLLCNTFVGYLGVQIGREPVILSTLIRLAKQSLTDDFGNENQSQWLEFMKRLLVPSLSLSKHNPGLTQEMYELLMFFPITTRFDIYGDWFQGRGSRLPHMKAALDYNRFETKDVLRRVTNETGKKQARALAKVAYSSPGVVTHSMIIQLESYSNMIPALVECTRYFSMLTYDVLTWSLLNSMRMKGRERTQGDGMLTSPWLQALAHFVASLFTRYSMLNLSPILQFLASELRKGNSTDLELFEQLLGEMAGIKPDMQFSDAQVQAMAGGEHLQSIIVQRLADMRHARKSSAKRLIKALTEPRLVGQLLVAITQEQQMYANHESAKTMPIKVVTNNVDKIHQIAVQYLDVLKSNLKPEEFEAAVPEVVSLIGNFGIEYGNAFTICRTAISHRMAEFDEAKRQEGLELKKRKASAGKEQASGDVEMQESDQKPAEDAEDDTPKATPSADPQESQTGDDDEGDVATPQPPASTANNAVKSMWHPVLEPIIERLPAVTGNLSDRISVPFFVTFWTLAQSDVVVFTDSYTQELDKLSKQISSMTAERGESTTAARERERKKKALQETADNLRNEVTSRVAVYSRISSRLSREKVSWFPKLSNRDDFDAQHVALLEECFLPRAMMSSLDAHFSFLMLKLLHDKGTPGFNTMVFLSHLFRKQTLASIMFQCTSQEAQHFGRFLNETLKMLAKWHESKKIYEKEAIGAKTKLPGFSQPLAAEGTESHLDYETYRRLLTNWHGAINSAIQASFDTGEYSHTRSSIIVLKAIHQFFPALNYHGNSILQRVTKLSQEETRQDLKIMAMSLIGPLKSREKKWAIPQAFRINGTSKDGKPGSRGASAKPETPKLNATAPEFKPGSSTGPGKRESAVGVEDGEVEEELQAAANAEDTEMKDESTANAPEGEEESGNASTSQPKKDEKTKTGGKSESKPSTPRPANGGNRPDSNRKGPNSLPNRVETPRSDHRGPQKPLPPVPTRGGRFPPRSDDQFGRLERPGSRDHSPGRRSRAHTPPGASRLGPPRDDRGPHRSARDDPWAHSRNDRSNGTGNSSSAPGHHPDRAGLINPASSTPTAAKPDSGYNENPARMAQINGDRGPRDSRGPPSRPEDRANERAGPVRSDDPTPKGPRGGKQGREATRDMAPPSDANFGRLKNGPPDSAPSGPRPPNGPGGRGRNFSSAQPPSSPASTQPNNAPRQSSDRRTSGVNTAPAASGDEPPISGMHPSRAAAFGVQPSPIQTNSPAPSGPRQTDSPKSAAPSGPRSGNRAPAGAPTGPSPTSSNPPAGPAAKGGERGRRNLNTINATLQGSTANPGPMSFRGASARQGDMSSSDGAQPPPPPPPPEEPRGRGGPRPELFQRGGDNSNRESGRERRRESDRQHGSRHPSREGRGGDERRYAQPPPPPPPGGPIDSSRDKRGPPRDDGRRPRDEREARDSRRAPPRGDEVLPRHPPPPGGPPPPYVGPKRPEWEHPAEDLRHGGRGGRGGADYRGSGGRPDERRAAPRGPGRDEGGGDRKRRHEEGPFDPAKRRRSGK